MRKGIPVLLCIILFSAISYADEKMVCYVPKKPEHKPVLPVKRHNIESKEVSIDNDTSSISSDLTSQSSQVFINLPQNLCNRGKGGDNEGNSEVSFELWKYFLEFIIKVLSIGTWPLVLFLVVKRFAPELKEIIPRVKTASGAGFSVELHKLNDKFNDINEDVTQEQEIKSNIDARSTIISAWLNIEAKLNKLLESRYNSTKTGITPNHGYSHGTQRGMSPMRLIQKLRHMEVISKEEYEMLDGLRRVRNQATHEYDLNVPEEDVINYLSLANFVEAKLSEKLVHND